jgi:phage shock protein PspC (stress-responsive transcriptional regulator)
MGAEQRSVRENQRHQPERTRAFASGLSVMDDPEADLDGGGGSGTEWGIFLRRGGGPAADHGGMETNDVPPQDDARDSASAGNSFRSRTLRRSHDRLLGGVGAGVADYLGTDVTATRVGLAATAVLAHVAIPAYAAAWALIPEEGKSKSRAVEFLDSVADRVDSAVNRTRQA